MNTETKKQGFALLSAEQRKELARKGQAALAAKGTRYKFTPETARAAALKARAIKQPDAAASA